jgi:hypothetical protein
VPRRRRSGDEPLVIPAVTLGEINYWATRLLGMAVWATFVEDIAAGAYRLEPPTIADLSRGVELETRYESLRLGFVDAAVIALCERLGECKVATLDKRNFSLVRSRHCDTLRLLPD